MAFLKKLIGIMGYRMRSPSTVHAEMTWSSLKSDSALIALQLDLNLLRKNECFRNLVAYQLFLEKKETSVRGLFYVEEE